MKNDQFTQPTYLTPGAEDTPAPVGQPPEVAAQVGPQDPAQQGEHDLPLRPGQASGRVKHTEKITVYLSSEELVELEQARRALRSEHDLRVDRGRVVRAAVGMVLQDLHERGSDSALVRQLRQQ